MDLVDRIETTRFLGGELIVWLWFKSELFEGKWELTAPPSAFATEPLAFGECEIWLDTMLVLESPLDRSERTTMVGLAPSGAGEAREALRQGKLPTRARITVRNGERERSFQLNAQALSFGGVKLPLLLREGDEEQLLERQELLEELDRVLEGLYAEFLTLRLSDEWKQTLLPAIRAWVHELAEPALTPKSYAAALSRASDGDGKKKRGKKR